LTFEDFSEEAMGQAVTHLIKSHRTRLIEDFAPCHVWEISALRKHITVFYLTDEDIQTNATNGCSERIEQRCCELARQFDEFGYFTQDSFSIRFDSKENLDTNYDGSMFAYSR
jgi:hypothetical protein